MSLFLNFFSMALVLLFLRFLPLGSPLGLASFQPWRAILLLFQLSLARCTCSLSSASPALGMDSLNFFFHFWQAFFPASSLDGLSSRSRCHTKFFLLLSHTRLSPPRLTGFSSRIIVSTSLVLMRGRSSNSVLSLGFFSALMYWEGFLKSFLAFLGRGCWISTLTPSTKVMGVLSLFFWSLYLSNSSISFLSRISFHREAFFSLSSSRLSASRPFSSCSRRILSTALRNTSFSGSRFRAIFCSSRKDFLGVKFLTLCRKDCSSGSRPCWKMEWTERGRVLDFLRLFCEASVLHFLNFSQAFTDISSWPEISLCLSLRLATRLMYSPSWSAGTVPQLMESASGQLTSFLETQAPSSTRQASSWQVTRARVWPALSALAVLPLRCTKIWWLLGQSQCTTQLTSGMSSPRAATSVTMSTQDLRLRKLSRAQVRCSMSILPQTPKHWCSPPTRASRQSTWNLVDTNTIAFSLLTTLDSRYSSTAAFSSGRTTRKSIFMVSGRAISWCTQLQSLSPARAKSLRSGVMVALNMRRWEAGHLLRISLSSFWNFCSPKSWSASSNTMVCTRDSLRSVSVSSCMSRPGVAMRMSGLMERDSNCPSQVCPPRMRVQRRSMWWRKALRTLVIWSARSRVGMRMSALAPLICECACSLLMMGSRQERVFPDPVLKHTTTSLPSCTKGMVFLCTAVGLLSLFIMMLRKSSGKNEYCANPFFWALLFAPFSPWGSCCSHSTGASSSRSCLVSTMGLCALLALIIIQYFEPIIDCFYWMSLFGKILGEFSKIKLNEKSKFTEYEVNRAMDQLLNLNTGFTEFDREIAEQLWEHTTKTPEGRVLLKDYIQTIIDARNILSENIDKCTKQLAFEQDPHEKQELQECVASYGEDYRLLGEPFLLQELPSKNQSLSLSQLERSGNNSQGVSQIFAENTSGREESTSLKVGLVLTLVLAPLEVLCMFSKHHFLNIMCCFSVISIFALNYFHSSYVKLCEVLLAASIVLDLLWLITHSGDYWNPPAQTQYSHLQPGFLKFVYVLTVLLMVGRALLSIILFRFTKNTESTSKFIRFLSRKIYLSGKSEGTPLTRVLEGRQPASDSPAL